MTSLDALLDAVRDDLARAARAAGEDPAAFRAVAEELRPFVDAAARARRPAVRRNSFTARPAADRAVRFAVVVGDLFAFTQMHSDRDLTP